MFHVAHTIESHGHFSTVGRSKCRPSGERFGAPDPRFHEDRLRGNDGRAEGRETRPSAGSSASYFAVSLAGAGVELPEDALIEGSDGWVSSSSPPDGCAATASQNGRVSGSRSS